MFDPNASQITITNTAILLRGAEPPAPIVDRRLNGRLLVATSGKKNAWIVLDGALVPTLLVKRIKLPSRVVEERIITPIEDLDATVALVEAWVVGGGREADEAAVAKKAATAAKRAATLKAKADAQAAADRAEAAEKAAAEAKARREAADAARPALVAACQAIAAGAVRFVTYPGFDGEFVVRTPYDPRVVEVLRAISGARWDEARRVWNVPARSHAALGARVADINAWCAQITAANAEAARVAEEARGAERAALAARRFIELADRVPAVGTTLRRGDRVVVVESHGKIFRAPEDDGMLDPWMEGEPVRYVYHRDATDDEVDALKAREPKAAPAAPEMVAQPFQQQQACAAAPAPLLEAVHGPDGADDPRLGDLASLRDLLRACWGQRPFEALLGDSDDAAALCETIRGVEDLYRRLASLTGQRTDIYDREHPDRVAAILVKR
ncbi:hypothetical protein [uncultured Methylobacterium sp.]|uniref:hypothetical protein n=1 Tax=uncultured Methylobacterium sp. TaxID=157278 RepID=UPI0035CBC298